jgi:hypothetical protein
MILCSFIFASEQQVICKKFESPLPLKRTRDMKRQVAFTNRVLEIEDFMTQH